VQEGHCFCCSRRRLRDTVAVDHFVPWRRYPFDLAHNFVLAHDRVASIKITRWAYEQVAGQGGQVWVKGNELVRLGREWEEVLDQR